MVGLGSVFCVVIFVVITLSGGEEKHRRAKQNVYTCEAVHRRADP